MDYDVEDGSFEERIDPRVAAERALADPCQTTLDGPGARWMRGEDR